MIARSTVMAMAAMSIVACADANTRLQDADTLTVLIANDGSLMIDGEIVDAATVKERAGDGRVNLEASPNLKYTEFEKAFSALQGLNIPIAITGEDAGPQ